MQRDRNGGSGDRLPLVARQLAASMALSHPPGMPSIPDESYGDVARLAAAVRTQPAARVVSALRARDEPGGRGDHRRGSFMDGVDDLGVVDPS